ncbi:MAG TPA: hypothetical protein VJB16_01065 [archaeon]|nr:hypothetical protein [archaeon]
MSVKLVLAWVFGALLLASGVWIIKNLELTIGVTPTSFALGFLSAVIAFLIAGLLWISVAVATRRSARNA